VNKKINILLLTILLSVGSVFAQLNKEVVEDFKPSSLNQPGKQYPQVNSQGCVRASISAPEANEVLLDIGGVKYKMKKDADGVWTGDSNPQDEGFHYYQLWIDGAAVPDPSTLYFYGAGRWGSGIEVPAKDQDFYALKNVPHGQVCVNLYFSEITGSWRRCFVYLPPGYESNSSKRYSVLYLQHGSFEDETGWASQGKANLILDNLIAEKKAVPMIIVMDNGYAFKKPDESADKNARPAWVFEEVMMNEIIPMIDTKYRTLSNQENRAIAGLSMGANQTIRIMMNNLERFDYIGGFSGTPNYPKSDVLDPETFLDGKFKDGETLKKTIKLFWLGLGTKEPDPFPGSVGAFCDMLKKVGVDYVFYQSEGTAHEWLTWRRDLYQFAQLLFK
jgi:enterochelin esterase-like enzyme